MACPEGVEHSAASSDAFASETAQFCENEPSATKGRGFAMIVFITWLIDIVTSVSIARRKANRLSNAL
jgi:hypothetical protein